MRRAAVLFALIATTGIARADAPSLTHPAIPEPGSTDLGELANLEKLVAATEANDPDMPSLQLRLARLLLGSAVDADRLRARDLLRDLFRNHSSFRPDHVLVALGVAQIVARNLTGARRSFMELIRNHPRSPLIPDAYCAFGDHFFDAKKYASADKFYEKVLQFPRSRAAPYASYKLGWSQLRQGKHQKALELFYRVHQRTRHGATADAARDAIVIAYAAVGKASKARAFFRRVDRREVDSMQHQLADRYARTGKHRQAIVSFRELLARSPADPSVCHWQAGVARSTSKIGNRRATATEITRLRALGRKLEHPLCGQLADEI